MGKTGLKKILVVDDDPDMRIFFAAFLKSNGYRPVVAKSGAEGFKKARKDVPDFIIIDVTLPENGGMKMYRDLKCDGELKNIPVMMISTIDEQTFIHYQRSKGIDFGKDIKGPEAFIEKPPEAKDVLNCIEEIFEKEEVK